MAGQSDGGAKKRAAARKSRKPRSAGANSADFPGLNPELAANAGADAKRTDAESAAELTAPDAQPDGRKRTDKPAQPGGRPSDAGRATGLFALAIAVASLFVWPLPLGLTAAVLGWYSFREGARGLGVWAVTIGLVAVLAQLVLIPIYAALS
jgi:hypothetical protein